MAGTGIRAHWGLVFIADCAAVCMAGGDCFIVFIERSVRKQCISKTPHGNKVFGGDQSFLPLKINVPGVIPPIFASSLLLMPVSIQFDWGRLAGLIGL